MADEYISTSMVICGEDDNGNVVPIRVDSDGKVEIGS